MRTPCTARIPRRPPPRKSLIFSRPTRSSRADMAVNLIGLDQRQLQAFCTGLGEKPFRARQLMRWIHHAGVDDFGAMTDMSKRLREALARDAVIAAPRALRDTTAADGTRKWLLDVGTGNAIET